jgi:hypothetical protein
MRCAGVLLVLHIGVLGVGGLALPANLHTPTSSIQTSRSAPITTTETIKDSAQAITQSTRTNTAAASSSSSYSYSSSKSTPLFLSVSASFPDPLGISRVSGFYGPGAWAAWFLTIVASWVGGIRESNKKVDVNTMLFLLGANWAAVDIFRSIHASRSLRPDQPEYNLEFPKGMGNYAAAFSVTFWGTFHSLLQMCFLYSEKRIRMLAVGIVLPLIALTATALGPVFTGMDGNALNDFPALYWKGMGDELHGIVVMLAAATLILLLAPLIAFLCGKRHTIFPRWVTTTFAAIKEFLNSDAMGTAIGFYILFSFITLVISVIICIAKNDAVYLWGMAPFLILFLPILLITGPMGWLVVIPGSIVAYICKGYLGFGSNFSESCFFMPCAPQTIKEEDQLYALLAGLLALGFELVVPVFKKLRDVFRERRLFIQDVEGRMRQFEMRRTTGAVGP